MKPGLLIGLTVAAAAFVAGTNPGLADPVLVLNAEDEGQLDRFIFRDG